MGLDLPLHSPERRLIEGRGTDENAWRATSLFDRMPTLDVGLWPSRFERIWILAPHPDDEVLALGGSIAALAAAHADVTIVSASDGEASHPESARWPRERLARDRPLELQRALDRLGSPASVMRLGLPDGRIDLHRDTLLRSLAERVGERDLLLTSCSFDGHPDHEACGQVAATVGEITGATVFEYPVWMWHWASPDEVSIPWARARRLPIALRDMAKKRAAIDEFVSQITPDGAHEPVLPPHVLPRFLRSFELVFA